MAFSLRLPPALDHEARIRADQIGVPLNGLICFALDLYLRGGSAAGLPVATVDELDFENPRRVSRGGMPLKISQQAKLPSKPPSVAFKSSPAPKSLPVAPLPGAKLSKSQRRDITAQARLARKS